MAYETQVMLDARCLHGLVLALALGSMPGCGGGGTPTSPGGTGGGGSTSEAATITISTAGVASPQAVTIRQGGRVTFVNSDTRPHDMSSDPHPEHSDCPELNQVGFLNAGQMRTSGNLNTVRTCGFHDHNQPANAGLQGRITIVAQ